MLSVLQLAVCVVRPLLRLRCVPPFVGTAAGDSVKHHAVLCLLAALSVLCSGSVMAEDWVTLFDGKSLKGWQPSRENTQFAVVDGVIQGTSSASTHFLHTRETYDDFELQLEVRLHDTDLNSGVQIRTSLTRTADNGKTRPVVHGPQVDIGKSPGRSGYLFGQGNKGWITPKEQLVSSKLMVNNEWNTVRVVAVGPRIRTWINGQPVTDVTDAEIFRRYPSGVIALQVHGVKKSPEKPRHVSFRNIRVRSLTSDQAAAVPAP